VLLARSAPLAEADAALAPALADGVLDGILRAIPDDLLAGPDAGGDFADADAARARYAAWLRARLASPRAFVDDAERARERVRRLPPARLGARR
jgi:hypothetical protein